MGKFMLLTTVIDRMQRHPASVKKLTYVVLALFLSLCIAVCVHRGGTDFYVYYMAAKAFHQGTHAYLMGLGDFKVMADKLGITAYAAPYYYPPLTAQLVLPLTFLAPKVAYVCWLILSIAATTLSVRFLAGKEYFFLGLLIAFGFLSSEVTLYAGQINALLLLALSVSYYGLSKNKYATAGLSLACGIMFKIIPIAHFCYLLWKGRIKVALIVLGGLTALLTLSLPFVGLSGWGDFMHAMSTYSQPETLKDIASNQALSGLIARIVHEDMRLTIWHISISILICTTALICLPQREGFLQTFDWEFALITTAVNLIMPYSWYHQNILLLIPLLLLLKNDIHEKNGLLLCILIGCLLTDLHGIFWHHLSGPTLTSLPTLFSLFLWLILSIKILQLKLTNKKQQPRTLASLVSVISSPHFRIDKKV